MYDEDEEVAGWAQFYINLFEQESEEVLDFALSGLNFDVEKLERDLIEKWEELTNEDEFDQFCSSIEDYIKEGEENVMISQVQPVEAFESPEEVKRPEPVAQSKAPEI